MSLVLLTPDIFRRAWLKWNAQVCSNKQESQLMSEWRGSKLCLVSAGEDRDRVHGLYMDGEEGHWKGGAGRSLVEGTRRNPAWAFHHQSGNLL